MSDRTRLRAFLALCLARLRESYREPEVLFWGFVFPLLLSGTLAVAFRERPPSPSRVVVLEGAAAERLTKALRGAPLGTAVADDYAFLARLAFQRPLDPFDSMGAAFYWRPVSRQLWFALFGAWLERAPWLAAALQAAMSGAPIQ